MISQIYIDTRCTCMLFYPVFAKLQQRPVPQTAFPSFSFSALTWLPQHSNSQPSNRCFVAVVEWRSRPGRDISKSLAPKSLRLNLFADPHPLNSIASIFYKNSGGQGVPRSAIPSRHFFSIIPLPPTLMDFLASVANKRLTARAKPFRCNTYKKPGVGVFFPFWYALSTVEGSTVEEWGDGDRSQGCTGPRGRTLREDQARPVSQSGVTSE